MARKEKMKVYHGLPKSVTDEHTVFYADFDGNTKSSVGCNISKVVPNFLYMPTGLGVVNTQCLYNTPCKEAVTIDFVLQLTPISNTKVLMKFHNSETGDYSLIRLQSDNTLHLDFCISSTKATYYVWLNKALSLMNMGESNYIRLVVKREGVICYINGVNQGMMILKQDITPEVYKKLLDIHSCVTKVEILSELGVSDLHISNIDRGDYFPTLPQDFIDGKAIVKPRMGQQQIKGDPMYSQVTELKVPHYTGTEYDLSNQNPDNLTYKCFDHPELSTYGSDTWNAQSVIKIKGLNEEVISGVIDNDTALAEVVESSGAVNSPATIKVDDVSKFQNGDKFRVYNITATPPTISGIDFSVNNVDASNNTLTVSWTNGQQAIFHNGVLLVETTASSSSPVVKTKEGTNVVGTWSGLGTNEAQFTLGQNHNIAGKDLYVTYALNIPSGNSDFPQLPHTVERAYDETGIEMKPVSEIVIVDDFRGKVKGSMKECPHISKWGHNSQLLNPNEFRDEVGMSVTLYNQLFNLDGRTCNIGDSTNRMSQQLFSFNLIQIVERKLGCEIPHRDKIQWLKDYVEKVVVKHTGCGKCPSGSLLNIGIYNQTSNNWITTWITHTSDTPTTKSNSFIPQSDYKVCLDGNVYLIAYTDASNGSTASIIKTDYVSLEIKLKVDPTFTALYCENTRAREDKCNPVLVQKETKTVKRFIPSKEPFVTECLFFKDGSSIKAPNILSDIGLYSEQGCTLLTYGTGKYAETGNPVLKGSIARLNPTKPSYMYTAEDLITNPNYLSTGTMTHKYLAHQGSGASYEDNFGETIIDTTLYKANNFLLTKRKLINDNGQMKLLVYMADFLNSRYNSECAKAYSIPNRPLIK